MTALAPWAVALPFAMAALLAASHRLLPHWALHALSLSTSLAMTVLCAFLLVQSAGGVQLHWFGGWVPSHGEPIGIVFAVQPLGAALALLACLVMACTFAYSLRLYDDVNGLYHALLLVFLGGVCGMSLTGDLFNLFVFFEVVGVSAFALTAYKNDLRGAIQGAIAFAVTNSLASILLLLGVALVYAQTGSLNLARAGEVLGQRALEAPTVAAFVLIAAGLLTKAGQFPFHQWVADAHNVAPIPINAVLSGALAFLGFWGLAHIYWLVFHDAFGAHGWDVQRTLVVLAVLSGAVGGLSALAQTDLKRILAFSIVAQGCPALLGLSAMSAKGLGGAAVHLFGTGLLHAALFMLVGRWLNQHGTANVGKLRGRARGSWVQAAVFFVAALGLGGAPGALPWVGAASVEEAVKALGIPALRYALLLSPALISGALLAAGCAVFFGWGPAQKDNDEGEGRGQSDERGEQRVAFEMTAVPAVLVALAVALAFVPQPGPRAEFWAEQLTRSSALREKVLRGEQLRVASGETPAPSPKTKPAAFASGGLALGAALALCGLWLERGRIPRALRRVAAWMAMPLHLLQSGDVCDYLLWMSAGLAVVGAVLLGGLA